jgi:tRNA(Phe) wybutosine-synthesizing methylase Tyw3
LSEITQRKKSTYKLEFAMEAGYRYKEFKGKNNKSYFIESTNNKYNIPLGED